MLQQPAIFRSQIICTLSRIRQEWQEAVDCSSLIQVDGKVGLLLADLINGIGLGTAEQVQVLGAELYQEMQDLLQSPDHN